jgi:hypothetical protein
METLENLIIPNDYSELTREKVEEVLKIFKALYSSYDKTADINSGALLQLVTRPAAVLFESARESFETAKKESSLKYLMENTSDRISAIIDELSYNYRITRKTGTPAYGTLRLIFERPITTTIGFVTYFQIGTITYRVQETQSADAIDSANPSMNTHRWQTTSDGSGYVFIDIPVFADQNGSEGNIAAGTEVELLGQNYASFVRCYAVDTFIGGSDDESDQQLIDRMLNGISAKVLSSRQNMRATLFDVFPSVRDAAIIGAGDWELTRDKHSPFPLSSGGYADWYIAPTRELRSATLILENFTPVSVNPDGSVNYSLVIGRDVMPCVIKVRSIEDTDTHEMLKLTSQRHYAIFDDKGSPYYSSDEEACFSAFHEVAVSFTASADVKSVSLNVYHAPGIQEIQQWVSNCNQSPVGLDILVKAPYPTQCYFSAVVNVPTGTDRDDNIPLILSDYINSAPMGSTLSISNLVALLHQQLPKGSYVTRAELFGDTLLPSGENYYMPAEEVLNFKDYYPMLSNKTTVYYADRHDITLEYRYNKIEC